MPPTLCSLLCFPRPLQKRLAEKHYVARESIKRRLAAVYIGVQRDLEGVHASLGASLEVAQDVNQNMRSFNRDVTLTIEKMSAMGVGPSAILKKR